MKNAVCLFLLSFAVGLLCSCSDDDDAPSLSFSKATYTMAPEESLNVEIRSSVAVKENTVVKFTISGTAVEGEDYTISAGEVIIKAGQNSAQIQITPKENYNEDRMIKLDLVAVDGYGFGDFKIALISIEPKDKLIYSFQQEYYVLANELTIELSLKKLSDQGAYIPLEDLHIPFSIAEESTAVEGTHFSIAGNIKEFVLKAGETKTKITINFLSQETDKDKLVLEMKDLGIRFVAGNFSKTTVKVYGSTTIGKLFGKWTFKTALSYDYWPEYLAQSGYPASEFTNFPRNNSNKDTLEFVTGEKDMLKVHMTGDFKNYFRDCDIVYLRDEAERLAEEGGYPVSKVTISIMRMSKANVPFSASKIKERAAEIGFRVLEDGKTLEVTVIDYEPVDFMAQVYQDALGYTPEGELPMRVYQLRYHFTKVE